MKTQLALAACILTILLLTGCWATQVEQNEQAWQDHKITSYRIEVLVVNSIWHAQSHQITVRDNEIESAMASCITAPMEFEKCKVQAFNAEDYTVAGLFRKARSEADSHEATLVKITYDASYHFPHTISYNNPKVIDGDWSWGVSAFEVLK